MLFESVVIRVLAWITLLVGVVAFLLSLKSSATLIIGAYFLIGSLIIWANLLLFAGIRDDLHVIKQILTATTPGTKPAKIEAPIIKKEGKYYCGNCGAELTPIRVGTNLLFNKVCPKCGAILTGVKTQETQSNASNQD